MTGHFDCQSAGPGVGLRRDKRDLGKRIVLEADLGQSRRRRDIVTIYYYAALLPRRGPHIASHSVCPSVCLSVRLSVRPVIVAIDNVFSSTASVTDVLFGTH